MKTFKPSQTSESQIKFNKVSQRNAIPVIFLFLLTLLFTPDITKIEEGLVASDIIWAIISVIAIAGLIATFISGYKRSDELEKMVQLKAAAISFVITIFGLFVMSILVILNIVSDIMAMKYFFYASFSVWFFFVLPGVAKRTYEK